MRLRLSSRLPFGAILLGPMTAIGVSLDMELQDMQGDGWSAQGVSASLTDIGATHAGVRVFIEQLSLPKPLDELGQVIMECERLLYTAQHVSCEDGAVKMNHPTLQTLSGPVSFRYEFGGPLDVNFRDLNIAGGSVTGNLEWKAPQWRLELVTTDVQALPVAKTLTNFFPALGYAAEGTVAITATLDGSAGNVDAVDLAADTSALSFSNAQSTRAGEALDSRLTMVAKRRAEAWQFGSTLELRKGQLYVDPIFVEAKDQPLALQATGEWSVQSRLLDISHIDITHPGVLQASGNFTLSAIESPQIDSLTVNATSATLPGAYESYLKPFLIGTPLDDLETAGKLRGSVSLSAQRKSVNLTVTDVFLDDKQDRFALYDIDGAVNWHDQTEPQTSTVSFSGGQLYSVDIGQTRLNFVGQDRNLKLTGGAQIPVFDGLLEVADFDLRDIGKDEQTLQLNAGLKPVSLEVLTQAFDWPPMTGQLEGVIPNARYENQLLSLGGALEVKVFDGTVRVSNLRSQAPFDLVPELSADVEIDDLDLESLTRAFSFGKIAGRLSGFIRKLELLNWQPVYFEAELATPDGDRSKHRISQRAVDNLTRLGNGVSGALSSTFLRVFKDFSYERIGISCRLENNVCRMDGIEAAESGYYIVKGSGIPRIDVKGFNREVAWPVLVDRLKNIDLESGPVIQ